MQDRFKFRFYDKDKKIMIDENSDTTYIASIYGRDEWYWCIEAKIPKILSYFDGEGFVEGKWHKFNFAIMQCTGLKDKNGKLIYEGDIVKFKTELFGKPKQIIWNECRYMLKNTYIILCNMEIEQFGLEVIGNIYENPELLEDTECQK